MRWYVASVLLLLSLSRFGGYWIYKIAQRVLPKGCFSKDSYALHPWLR